MSLSARASRRRRSIVALASAAMGNCRVGSGVSSILHIRQSRRDRDDAFTYNALERWRNRIFDAAASATHQNDSFRRPFLIKNVVIHVDRRTFLRTAASGLLGAAINARSA